MLSFFARFRILPKILSVIALIGVIVGLSIWYMVGQMRHIDERFSQFIDADTRAAATAARINRAISDIQTLAYRIVAETSPDEMRKIEAAFAQPFAEIKQLIDDAKKHAPHYGERFEALARGAEQAQLAITPVIRLALSNENERALATLRNSANPVLGEWKNAGSKLRNDITAAVDKGSVMLTEETGAVIRNSFAFIGAGLIIGFVCAFLIAYYGITKPIHGLVALLQRLAKGDYDIEIVGADRRDEVGDIAKAAQVFKENGLARLRMEQEVKEAEKQAAQRRKEDMRKLADEFEAAVGNIVETVSSAATELEAAAQTLTRTADTTQRLSTAVAAASEQASANVQSVATATEEMAGSVNEIGRQVQESTRIAAEAVNQAQATDARVMELSQAAERIGDVVKLITTIAEQTNLLALNATIEAARAGEAGKGFAVVAQEVKQLAAQTAKATSEIGGQIAAMQGATQDSVRAIKEIGATINRISEIASTIAAAVEEQGAATQDIARNVQQAAQGTQQVANNITEVNRGAAETGSASAQVLASAQSLANDSARLKKEVDKFLATVRAA